MTTSTQSSGKCFLVPKVQKHSKELISRVNKVLFVIMFDESRNRTTKNKQLDNRWDWHPHQSRFCGSQFMGHSTADDLSLRTWSPCWWMDVMLIWSLWRSYKNSTVSTFAGAQLSSWKRSWSLALHCEVCGPGDSQPRVIVTWRHRWGPNDPFFWSSSISSVFKLFWQNTRWMLLPLERLIQYLSCVVIWCCCSPV